MKRSLRQNQNTGVNKQNVSENNLNAQQRQQLDRLKGMAKQYEGKSQNEILRDLTNAVEKGKADGSLSNEKIDGIAASIAPMLNSEQKNKLAQLMRTLKH